MTVSAQEILKTFDEMPDTELCYLGLGLGNLVPNNEIQISDYKI